MNGLDERRVSCRDKDSEELAAQHMDTLPVGTIVYNTDKNGNYFYFLKVRDTPKKMEDFSPVIYPNRKALGGVWQSYEPVHDQTSGMNMEFHGVNIFRPAWIIKPNTSFTSHVKHYHPSMTLYP
ncbi:hypothetical protein SEA_ROBINSPARKLES_43 [Gordonia phage RobinSparkles]|nr:hypothetical protein SEA_ROBINSPARKLES_43 [Gordonia phage RobinSparkles]